MADIGLGLFTKPFEETKKKGVKGLFSGAFQGLTGLVVKPITGVLDAASKTAEGVKNTAFIFDKEKEDQRERDPRVFYGFDKAYDNYNLGDVEVMRILKKKKKGRFANNCYFGFRKFLPSAKSPNAFHFMIFTMETLINYDCSREKFEWYFPVSNIKAVGKMSTGVKIYLKEHDKKVKVPFIFACASPSFNSPKTEEQYTKIEDEGALIEIAEKANFLVEMHLRREQM